MSDHAPSPGGSHSARIAIIGTGFAGLGMAIRLKQAGIDDFVVLEKADDVGGTWRDNTYPGCACDVPSNLYSFSFALNPDWTSSYSAQPEIWEYLRRTAREHGVLPHIRFDHEVVSAAWDEQQNLWCVQTSQGPFTAAILISGTGALSEPSFPAIPGLEDFGGHIFHSAQWDHDYDLTGKKVAVVGTGASAIQFVPQIQPQVEQLDLFQRTPPWVAPRLDRPFTAIEKQLFRRVPLVQRLARDGIYWARELMVVPWTVQIQLTKVLETVAWLNLRSAVGDPGLRAKLTPDYKAGCKRLLTSNDYYPSLTKPNVDVITEGIREISARGVVTTDGVEHEADVIIFGTGFHVTDASYAEMLRGRDGKVLAEGWAGSPQAYLGTTVAGFPNLFLLVGPNTGQGHTSMVYMIESQVTYILDALRYMDAQNLDTVEVRRDTQEQFNERLQSRMGRTVWVLGGCASWYLDAFGRNTTLWPTFSWVYRLQTRRFNPAHYLVRRRVRTPQPASVS